MRSNCPGPLAWCWTAALATALLCLAAAPFPRSSDLPSDPDDTTVWPNRTSRANSDRWLVENHDRIRAMYPRVLLINFSNEHPRERLELMAKRIIAALAEGSRYHGYRDRKAKAFLNYRVWKFVDLRDPGQKKGNSDKIPLDPNRKTGFNMTYNAYFSDRFARYYGVRDPKNSKRFLRLDELVAAGYVHEVWFFAEHTRNMGAYECVELKPVYDDKFRRVADKYVQAGNGGDRRQKWTGRSVRIGFINASRGIGCFMESLSHSLEGTSNSKAIPYFSRYFCEYAGFDLKTRYKLPFDSLYAVQYGKTAIRYPQKDQMVVTHGGKEYTVKNYVAAGGNAHFPPNARRHYDLDNRQPVLSTIEDWRIGSGKGGKDLARPWTNAAFRDYRDRAPDCMGPWLIYWRQNMPGLNNRARDDDGKPMKNWWPFLFY